jgi:hypothetical protein
MEINLVHLGDLVGEDGRLVLRDTHGIDPDVAFPQTFGESD